MSVFGKGLAALLWRLLSRKTDLVHIHLADGVVPYENQLLPLLLGHFVSLY
jgi:hypothetical protein